MENIKIGLLGCGTVGTGVIQVLKNNCQSITSRVGRQVDISKVLVRDTAKKREVAMGEIQLTTNADDILNDPEISIVVEVIGGINPAKEYVLKALRSGKSVVTANKDLLAMHGKELFDAATYGDVDLRFEASVAGGIPIIGPLKESLTGNKIKKVMGIINGTTNYILTKMSKEAEDFYTVLKEAQQLGYAEADPTADIEGLDAARKIAILASIAFNSRVTFSDVYVEGISNITASDIIYAKELGFTIKLLGIAKEEHEEVEVRVHPAFIPLAHPLANVDDVYNAVYVEGDAVGDAMFFGRGAGQLPTASAVVGDVIAIAKSIAQGVSNKIYCTCFKNKKTKPIREIASQYYLRLTVQDQPGVLANIASVFANQDVSIATVIQKKRQGKLAEIVLITHLVKEANLQDALNMIKNLSCVAEINNLIRVEGLV